MTEVNKEKSAARLASLQKVAAADRSAKRLETLKKCAERNFVKVSDDRSALRRIALMKSAGLSQPEFKELMQVNGVKPQAVDPEYSAYRRRLIIGKVLSSLMGGVSGGMIGYGAGEGAGAAVGAGAGALAGLGLSSGIDALQTAVIRERLKAIKEKRNPSLWAV